MDSPKVVSLLSSFPYFPFSSLRLMIADLSTNIMKSYEYPWNRVGGFAKLEENWAGMDFSCWDKKLRLKNTIHNSASSEIWIDTFRRKQRDLKINLNLAGWNRNDKFFEQFIDYWVMSMHVAWHVIHDQMFRWRYLYWMTVISESKPRHNDEKLTRTCM